jgi:prepilin-type N-terminal cleavage/methylation domain-containing protein
VDAKKLERIPKMTEVRKSRAFTLVELLVVISIIALLLAILVPALGRARNQARLVTCSANAKQIGTIMEVYQADNNGFVPVMRNKFTEVNAKSAFLSIPFRRYSGATTPIPRYLSPDIAWDDGMKLEYALNYLPDFYICPFARGAKVADFQRDVGTIRIGTVTRKNYVSTGRMDSYSTWIWPRPKNFDFWPEGEHPWGPPNGYNKYGNVVWHTAGSPDAGNPDDPITSVPYHAPNSSVKVDVEWLEAHPRKFANVRRVSEKTALYCAHGEIDESNPQNRIMNYGSHKKSNRGGTNVVFGDSHVEWVQGSQISAGN